MQKNRYISDDIIAVYHNRRHHGNKQKNVNTTV